MTAAILISGYLRNYIQGVEYIKTEIIPKFNKCDIYLHITQNESVEDVYDNHVDSIEDWKKIKEQLLPVAVIVEANDNLYQDKLSNNTHNQWSKLHLLNLLKQKYETTTNTTYDVVIRFRLDLNIKSTGLFDKPISKLCIPSDSKINTNKLIKLTDKYICDAFAYGPSPIMDQYLDIYTCLPQMIEQHGGVSENLLYLHLNNNNIEYDLIDIDYEFILSKCNVFAICGDSGSGKSTLSGILQRMFSNAVLLEGDRYHKWDRSDTRWKNTTHLNPDANYLAKMHTDVYNLKLGKEIYQVNYDHNTGKFTDKQTIKSADNVIVCGLHSLYGNNNDVYNIKIFMDTQTELKNKWKIHRDVKERGHNVDKVIENIKKRKIDYETYILPQKENADIIINFYTDDKINLNDIDKDITVKVKVFISKKYDISKVISLLQRYNIPHNISYTLKHSVFTFNKYTELPLVSKILPSETYTLYDYIVIILFNLVE
jgi:uridine kinase